MLLLLCYKYLRHSIAAYGDRVLVAAGTALIHLG